MVVALCCDADTGPDGAVPVRVLDGTGCPEAHLVRCRAPLLHAGPHALTQHSAAGVRAPPRHRGARQEQRVVGVAGREWCVGRGALEHGSSTELLLEPGGDAFAKSFGPEGERGGARVTDTWIFVSLLMMMISQTNW